MKDNKNIAPPTQISNPFPQPSLKVNGEPQAEHYSI